MFKTDQSSLITAVIETLDIRRDSAFWGISKNIDSYAHHFTPAMVTASTLLSEHLSIFGTATEVATSNLQSETATIRSIVTDFTTTVNLVAAITLLGLTTWVSELKTANDALAVKYLERTVEIGAANPNTIKDKRLEANAGYFELRDMINGYNTISKGATMYTKTTSELNALIAQYNLVLTNRAATPTPPTPPTPPVGPVA